MRKLSVIIVAAPALLAGAAMAHHSAAMFDQSKLIILRGTLQSFSYVNPHSWISLQATPDGKGPPERWDIEAVAPGALARMGITGSTLKPGDKVTMGTRPLRDGRHAGSMVFLVASDGKSYGAKPGELGLSVDDLKPQ